METIRLKQFSVLVETGNLRKAAELLAISHSGLSKSMKVLEDEMGYALFHQSGRGIVISDEGKRLYELSKKILTDIDALYTLENDSASAVLRIGSFETFTNFFIGPLLKDYLPGRNVEIHELIPGRLEEALAFNKVDVGITYEPMPRKGIEYIKVATLTMGTFALKGSFSGHSLEEIPFVAPALPLEGAPSGVKGQDAWPDEKIKRNVCYRVDLLSTGLELVRQGLGAIFIPRFVAELHNESVRFEKRLEILVSSKRIPSVKRDVYIVKRESSGEDKTIRQVAKALRAICL
jgi:DNA-binding transcriptional LysR family regulator